MALWAQGFADGLREKPSDGWALRKVLSRVGLLQIDSVNVLQRAHYLPLFARVGPYDTEMLDRASWNAPRRLFEYWGHEASLLPVAVQPLLRWRMESAYLDAWGGIRKVAEEHPDLVERVLRDGRRARACRSERAGGARGRPAAQVGAVVGLVRTRSARWSSCSGADR